MSTRYEITHWGGNLMIKAFKTDYHFYKPGYEDGKVISKTIFEGTLNEFKDFATLCPFGTEE